jgi:hypothetical protein
MAVEKFAGESGEFQITLKDNLGVEIDPSTLNDVLVYTSWEHTKEPIAKYRVNNLEQEGYRSCSVEGNKVIFYVEASDTDSHDIGNIRVLVEIHIANAAYEDGIEVVKKAATLIKIIK